MIPRTLRGRLFAVASLLVALWVVLGYVGALTFGRVSRAIGTALSGDREAATLLSTLGATLEDEDDVVLRALSGGETDAPREIAAERVRFDQNFATLGRLTTDPEERALLEELGRDIGAYRPVADEVVQDGTSRASWSRYDQTLAPIVRHATSVCGRIREHRFEKTERLAEIARDEARHATWVVSAAFIAAIALLGAAAWHVARFVLTPLRELAASVDAMRAGNFERRVRPPDDDELGKLATGFNLLAEAVSEFERSQLGEVLAANATLEAALEGLPEAVLVLAAESEIVKMNARARALLAPLVERMPARFCDLPLPGAGATAEAGAGNPSRADLARAIPVQVGDEVRRFSMRRLPVSEAPQGGIQEIVVLDDVTEFARLDEMRTEFIAAASHELRTPLTTLGVTLALLEEIAPTLPDAARETLETAQLGCEQLVSTVDEFLDLAKAEAGALGYQRARVDVDAWLDEMVELLKPRFEERGVTLSSAAHALDAAVVGDRARLSSAVSNVLGNALKYSPPHGTVILGAEREGASIVVTVDDQGPGVPFDLRERIFEKYFRVEHERSIGRRPNVHGAGIGLYLCRNVVEAHGGHVRCTASPRGGARFSVSLPVAASVMPLAQGVATHRAEARDS